MANEQAREQTSALGYLAGRSANSKDGLELLPRIALHDRLPFRRAYDLWARVQRIWAASLDLLTMPY